MKKVILVLSLCCIVLGLFSGCYIETNYYDEEESYFAKHETYFRTINNMIKDTDFHVAKAEEGKIMLYNEKYEQISEIPFAYYNENIKFIYARKNGPVVYFVTAIEADDERGIMFLNGDSDSVLSGVKRITRIGDNSYDFSTML